VTSPAPTAAATSPVALVGFGPWGRNLGRNLHALGALHTVVDPDRAARAEASKQYPAAQVLADPADVPQACAVVIAAPAAQHARLARFFLERGQHVFVEKPLALEVADCPPLIAAAESRGLVLMVGHLLHHHPAVDALDLLVKQGALGRLLYVYSNRLNLGRFRREENSLWSFAPHDIAVMLRLVGDLPARVACHGGNFLHPRIADTTLTSLSWASGVQAHVYVSWLHPFKEQRLVVVGQDAMAVFDDTVPRDKLLLYRHGVDWKNGMPVPRKAEPEAVPLPPDEPLRREVQAFLHAVAHPQEPIRADGHEGMRVLTVLAAAEHSLQTGGQPVAVAEVGGSWSARGVQVHETAVVGEGARIGAGSKVWHFVHVMAGARIGKDCVIGQNCFVQAGAVLGDRVRLQNNVSVYDGVELGDGVFCGPSCVFTNVNRPRADVSRRSEFAKTPVGQGATIGANATVICGHAIGAFAFVGAGSVVAHDVPAHALVVGNPARIVGWVCRCGERLALSAAPSEPTSATCHRCAANYRHDGGGLQEVA
jgi:UDP-2-acetamido-3-amino-2,3-dideoxy-glucuronate N-acetyltransferase